MSNFKEHAINFFLILKLFNKMLQLNLYGKYFMLKLLNLLLMNNTNFSNDADVKIINFYE